MRTQLAIGLALVSTACGNGKYLDGMTFDEPIARVVVENGKGDIEITDGFVTRVDWYGSGSFARPSADAWVDGDTLYVVGSCSGLLSCSVDHVLEVPEGVDIFVAVTTGDVTLHEAEGAVVVEIEQGSLEAWTMQPTQLEARIVEGDAVIELLDPAERVDVEIDKGDIELQLPDGKYAVETGGDEVNIQGVSIDSSMPYAVRALTWDGKVDIVGT